MTRVRLRIRIGLAALAALALAPPGGAAADECDPWPAEPRPLPRVDDRDPLRARWAALRVEELSERARLWERGATIEAHLMWRRVLCLDPGSEAARRGEARTRPVRVHRPAVVAVRTRPSPDGDPWAALATRIAVVWRRPSPAPAPGGSAARADAALSDAEALLVAARFEEALAALGGARRRVAALQAGSARRTRAARLELLSATAQVALGDERAARASLLRALEADPSLRLDPQTTSPKVLRAFDAARAERATQR